jgi:hypothetical protein
MFKRKRNPTPEEIERERLDLERFDYESPCFHDCEGDVKEGDEGEFLCNGKLVSGVVKKIEHRDGCLCYYVRQHDGDVFVCRECKKE